MKKTNYYLSPGASSPIKQGDIFYPLPYVRGMSLTQDVFTVNEGNDEVCPWIDAHERENITTTFPVASSWGIVLTQDCDTQDSPYISFIQIGFLTEITEKGGAPTSLKAWARFLTKRIRAFPSVYYLPPDVNIGFEERMYANLGSVFQIERESLEKEKERLRKGRLNKVAREHFREQIAQYFRRYPYEQHYPLSLPELQEYEQPKGRKVRKFAWQKSDKKISD